MTMLSPIHAFAARRSHAPADLRRETGAEPRPISPLLVYPIAAAISLALWAGLAELIRAVVHSFT